MSVYVVIIKYEYVSVSYLRYVYVANECSMNSV